MFTPSSDNEDIIVEYLEEARRITGRSDDFLLQVLYENDFNTTSAFRCLRKVFIPVRFLHVVLY